MNAQRTETFYRYAGEIAEDLDTPVIAVLPDAPPTCRRDQSDELETFALADALDPIIRALRASTRSVHVAGISGDVGRDAILLSLARILAETGRRILVVDADADGPPLAEADAPGLTDVLAGDAAVTQAVVPSPGYEGMMAFLPIGSRPAMLEAPGAVEPLVRVLEDLRPSYDVMLVSAPCLDRRGKVHPVAMASEVVLLVLAPGVVSRDRIRRNFLQLWGVEAPIEGLVTLGVPDVLAEVVRERGGERLAGAAAAGLAGNGRNGEAERDDRAPDAEDAEDAKDTEDAKETDGAQGLDRADGAEEALAEDARAHRGDAAFIDDDPTGGSPDPDESETPERDDDLPGIDAEPDEAVSDAFQGEEEPVLELDRQEGEPEAPPAGREPDAPARERPDAAEEDASPEPAEPLGVYDRLDKSMSGEGTTGDTTSDDPPDDPPDDPTIDEPPPEPSEGAAPADRGAHATEPAAHEDVPAFAREARRTEQTDAREEPGTFPAEPSLGGGEMGKTHDDERSDPLDRMSWETTSSRRPSVPADRPADAASRSPREPEDLFASPREEAPASAEEREGRSLDEIERIAFQAAADRRGPERRSRRRDGGGPGGVPRAVVWGLGGVAVIAAIALWVVPLLVQGRDDMAVAPQMASEMEPGATGERAEEIPDEVVLTRESLDEGDGATSGEGTGEPIAGAPGTDEPSASAPAARESAPPTTAPERPAPRPDRARESATSPTGSGTDAPDRTTTDRPADAPATAAPSTPSRSTPRAAASDPAGAPSMTSSRFAGEPPFFAVHITSFRSEDRAAADATRLGDATGYGADYIDFRMTGGEKSGLWYRVIVGRFSDYDAAKRAAQSIISKGITDYAKVFYISAP